MAKRKRGQNEGSIYKTLDGRWRAAVHAGYKNGKRVRKVLSGKTRAEVAEKLKTVLRDQQLGVAIATERQTVGQFLTRWLEDVAKLSTKPMTFVAYESMTRLHLIPGLGKIQLSKLTAEHVQAFLKEKLEAKPAHTKDDSKEKLTARTVRHLRNTLRNALNVAVQWQLIPRNPAALATPPKVRRAAVKVFDPDQAKAFLELVSGHRLEALFTTAISVGMREAEILGLPWSNVDLERGTLIVSQQLQRINKKLQVVDDAKSSHGRRHIDLPAVLVSSLAAHRLRQEEERAFAGSKWVDTGLVFTTSIGTPIDQRNLLREYYKLRLGSDLPHIRFHDLRHSAATLLLAQGVHPRVVMELLGHSTIRLTMDTYSHVIPAFRKDAAAKMNDILKPVATSMATKRERKNLN